MSTQTIKTGPENETYANIVYFVIVAMNNEDLIIDCIKSIASQSYTNVKIILVDNNSIDNTLNVVKQNFKGIKIIENSRNEGFAIANNQGIDMALKDKKCGYVALLNTDARVSKDWAQTIVKFAEGQTNCAGLQTITLDYYNSEVLDSRGIKVDPQGRAIQLGYRELAQNKYKHTKIFGVNAAACIYTAHYLRSQPFGKDYFDSDLWMYLEDVDLAARSIMLGFDNWLVSGSSAFHMGSASSSKNPGFSVFYIYRNNILMLLKNFPFLMIIAMIPSIVYTDIKTCLTLARSSNYRTIKAIIKGRIAALRLLPLFLKKRRILRKNQLSKNFHKLMRAT